ncbi:hypothetical protein DIPPA_26644 [Diplonema papillatum]|nr:hypothetical protein DIPPA_26644 [Diplonema papillatum]
MQEKSASNTYVVEGGWKIPESELPQHFFAKSVDNQLPCAKEKNAVQQCLEDGLGPQCEAYLDAFNQCESKYYTVKKVQDIAERNPVATDSS